MPCGKCGTVERTKKRDLEQRIKRDLIPFLNREREGEAEGRDAKLVAKTTKDGELASLLKTILRAVGVLHMYENHQQDTPDLFLGLLRKFTAVQALARATVAFELAVEKGSDVLSAANEILFRIRQCDYCEKWFFASRGDARFCTRNCAQAWAATEEGKKHLKQYRKGKAQEYRDRTF
jgi:hypothetical protein